MDVSKFNASLYSNTANELSPYLNTAANRKVNMTEGTATGTDGTFKKGDAVSYRNYLMTFDANNKLVFTRRDRRVYTNRAYLHLTGSRLAPHSTYDTEALYNGTYGLSGTENVAAAMSMDSPSCLKMMPLQKSRTFLPRVEMELMTLIIMMEGNPHEQAIDKGILYTQWQKNYR